MDAADVAEGCGDLFRLHLVHAMRHQTEQGQAKARSGRTDGNAAPVLAAYFAAPPLMAVTRFGPGFLSEGFASTLSLDPARRRAIFAELAAENDLAAKQLLASA